MNDVLSLVLAGMHADLARLDHSAMNLANVQTPGYKREIALRLPFPARVELGAQGGDPAGTADRPQAVQLAVHATQIRLDHHPNQLFEADLRRPAQLLPGLARVAQQQIHLGGADVARLHLHALPPVGLHGA